MEMNGHDSRSYWLGRMEKLSALALLLLSTGCFAVFDRGLVGRVAQQVPPLTVCGGRLLTTKLGIRL